jgi:hypothetical protein
MRNEDCVQSESTAAFACDMQPHISMRTENTIDQTVPIAHTKLWLISASEVGHAAA